MKSLVRLFVAGIVFVVAYFVFGLVFSLLFSSNGLIWLRTLGSPIAAILAATFTWWGTASLSQGLAGSVVLGAILIGGIGFVGGFFGPIIFDPGANQGPLLGIFITGPLGAIVGAVGGAVYWGVRGRRTVQ
jgi:hypothetical protein